MKKTQKYIVDLLSKTSGNILGIGLEKEEYIKTIEKNENITICNLLNSYDGPQTFKNRGRQKKVNIHKIRKKFKKNRVDEIYCNYYEILEYQKSFIPDSIYIGKSTIYLFGSILNDSDLEKVKNLEQKYKHYPVKIKKMIERDYFIYTIDIKNTKSTILADLKFRLLDGAIQFLEGLSNLLN